jgi:transposase
MRPPASIKPHLSINEMFQWLQNAPDEDAHKRRMAIWLTHTGNLYAKQVAKVLGVSLQAVWMWIRQYNDHGPAGLERIGRGGRRWGFLTPEQEIELLKPYIRKLRNGVVASPSEIKNEVEEKLGRTVSAPYVYRLLQRHQWAEIIAQSSPIAADQKRVDDYLKVTRPWLRNM